MDTVRIFDTTLRDGEQSPGATLTRVGAGGDSRVGVPAGAEREYRDESEHDEGDLAQAAGHATRQFI